MEQLDHDLLLIGPLVEALELPEHPVRLSAASRLIALLPRLHEGDFDYLDEVQRQTLRRVLSHTRNPGLACAILAAVAQIGRAEDLRVVERLAAGQRASMRSEEVLSAARHCLAALRDRSARPKVDSLLRPVPESADELSLLRAAATDSRELLRPAPPDT